MWILHLGWEDAKGCDLHQWRAYLDWSRVPKDCWQRSPIFALAHEYAHAYLQHDLRLFDPVHEGKNDKSGGHSQTYVETRRRFEKEADGIAARKAKQLGFDINNILEFILTMPTRRRESQLSRESTQARAIALNMF